MDELSPLPNSYNALTLAERAALLRANDNDCAFDAQLAEKRRSRWRAQRPFNNETLFEQRLAQDKLTSTEFVQILGRKCKVPASAPRELIQWAEHLAHQPNEPVGTREASPAGFAAILTGQIGSAREQVRCGLSTLLGRFMHTPAAGLTSDVASLETMLYAQLARELERVLAPTLALEIHVARLQGDLPGSTAQERFAAYVDRLRLPEVAGLLAAEYPVLFRLGTTRINIWTDVSLKLIERLFMDWEEICSTFFTGLFPGPLIGVHSAQSSTKRGGQSVTVFEFASGRKLVYKPRSLALECHFQELLAWLNGCGHQPSFRLLALLDRGAYGWAEFVDAAACTSEAEVHRFYQRQGAYLALLYALEATDLHLSNVIATGEHPMLIDLEALFHPRDADPDWLPLELRVDRALYHSVLRSGLLPEPELADDESLDLFDTSGLTGAPGQQTPYLVPRWEDKDTDAIRRVHKHVQIRGGKNLPALTDRPVNVVDYRAAIDGGFTSLYRFLIERRAELLKLDGMLARFAGDEVRVLPRSGSHYRRLLEESLHPDLMRDALERDRYLDRLWEAVESEPYLARLVAHEQADLRIGDMPSFTTRAGSRAVYSSAGQRIPSFFPSSALELAYERILALDETDLELQRWLIQASLATISQSGAGAREQKPAPSYTYTLPSVISDDLSQELLNQACVIATRLEDSAICEAGEATWIGLSLVADRHWVLEPLGIDLYNGLPGVALFLSHLGVLTREERWTRLARATVTTLLRYVAEETEASDAYAAIGAFDGLGGVLYTFAHLAMLWQEPKLIDTAEALAQRADASLRELAENEQPGLANGIAGCLTGLLALYQTAPTARTLGIACQGGEQLLQCIQMDGQVDDLRPVMHSTTLPFGDFLHGLSGAAWPLLALAQVSGDERWRTHGIRLLNAALPQDNATAGHLLASLRALPWLDSESGVRLETAIRVCLPATLEHGLGHNHSLGHGDLGYLDLLVQAASMSGAQDLQQRCAAYATAVNRHILRNGWTTGVPFGIESPGLMAGLAGIGYGLLRLAAPGRVPSVLALAMPER